MVDEIRKALLDPWFHVCLVSTAAETELVEQFDRLYGTTLVSRATSIERLVDRATGKTEDDMEKFVEFVYRYVYLIVPRPH